MWNIQYQREIATAQDHAPKGHRFLVQIKEELPEEEAIEWGKRVFSKSAVKAVKGYVLSHFHKIRGVVQMAEYLPTGWMLFVPEDKK